MKQTIVNRLIVIRTALFLVLYMITSDSYFNILNRPILFYHIIGEFVKKVHLKNKIGDYAKKQFTKEHKMQLKNCWIDIATIDMLKKHRIWKKKRRCLF